MNRILALVDGSAYSKSVCEHAAWVAGRTGSPVELLHVLGRRETGSAPSDLSGSIALGARTALLEELATLDEQKNRLAQKRGRAILDDAKTLIESLGVATVTTKLRIGDIVEAVTEAEPEAGLVIVGKRGEGADFAKLHLGSNLERIARQSRKPLLVASRALKPIAGSAEKVISEMVEREGIDLLAMGAYGHSRIRSLIIGSTTTDMIRSCRVPVVLFR